MARTMLILFLRWTPWAIAAGALAFTVWAFDAQIGTQHELNTAMQGVKVNIGQARDLTAETARVLSPLASTADTLAAMNHGLKGMIGDLNAMNDAMGRVAVRQQAILDRIGSLNGHTTTVIADLGTVDGKNKALLTATASLTSGTAGQADSVESLSGLTRDAINHLHNLNRKFGFLSQF